MRFVFRVSRLTLLPMDACPIDICPIEVLKGIDAYHCDCLTSPRTPASPHCSGKRSDDSGFLENPVADIVSARLFIRAGKAQEAPEAAGLASFLMGLLTKGTQTLSSLEIAEAVESVGASLGTDAAADYSVISLKTVSADFGPILSLAASLLRSPSFPEPEIDFRTATHPAADSLYAGTALHRRL